MLIVRFGTTVPDQAVLSLEGMDKTLGRASWIRLSRNFWILQLNRYIL